MSVTVYWDWAPEPDEVEAAVAFARGIDGLMRPCPEAADSASAVALLRYASDIQDAGEEDEPNGPQLKHPQYRPRWFWNIVSRIALWYWERQERKAKYARVREWFESRKDSACSTSHERTSDSSLAVQLDSNTKDSHQ